MKNWDPLSIFKYLTGSPTMHLVMLMNYYFTAPLMAEDTTALDFEAKSNLINRMWYSHMYSALAFFVLESGFLELFIEPSIIIPSLSLFIQIICYQGIVFEELNFFIYRQLSYMNTDGEKGLFADFERWDILIMLDIVLFLSNILMLFIFCIGTTYTGNIDIRQEDIHECCGKDFMEGNVDTKKFTIQVNSLAIGNAVYLYLIYIDVF